MVLVGTKKAGNVGAVARACGAFECEDLRLVAPRADPYTRASLSAAKGAQHILRGAGVYDTLEDALLDAGKAVAFHVWIEGFDDDASSSRASNLRHLRNLLRALFAVGPRRSRPFGTSTNSCAGTPPSERTSGAPSVGPRGTRRPRTRRTRTRSSGSQTPSERAYYYHPRAKRGNSRRIRLMTRARDGPKKERPQKNKTQTQTPGPWRVRTHTRPPRTALTAARGNSRWCSAARWRVWRTGRCGSASRSAIPTGRVIESLSVSHAAVISLSRYFEEVEEKKKSDNNGGGRGRRRRAGGGGGRGGERKKGFIRGS